jgi:small GTP-binding protein
MPPKKFHLDLNEDFQRALELLESDKNVFVTGRAGTGKSTLLNVLLNEERAIVTEIAGTTRDVIEDVLFIEGIKFRFIDTAGIRKSKNIIEKLGVEKSLNYIEEAEIIQQTKEAVNMNQEETKGRQIEADTKQLEAKRRQIEAKRRQIEAQVTLVQECIVKTLEENKGFILGGNESLVTHFNVDGYRISKELQPRKDEIKSDLKLTMLIILSIFSVTISPSQYYHQFISNNIP